MKKIVTALGLTAVLLSGLPATAGAAPKARQSQPNPSQPAKSEPRQTAQANQQYFRCAQFSLRVYNACLGQAKGDPAKSRACRQHYQANIVRCQNANR